MILLIVKQNILDFLPRTTRTDTNKKKLLEYFAQWRGERRERGDIR